MKVCSIDGCIRSAEHKDDGRRGMCSIHYTRNRKHGDPLREWRPSTPAIDWLRAHSDYKGDDCLKWPFHTGDDGYGRAHHPSDGRLTTAAFLMCEIAHGPRPGARHECGHSCGNGKRGCVNPNHLRWLTPTQNQRERAVHGTSNRGERQWMARLTEADVRAIRGLAGEVSGKDIAARFGLHQSYVSQIIHRRRWGWLD